MQIMINGTPEEITEFVSSIGTQEETEFQTQERECEDNGLWSKIVNLFSMKTPEEKEGGQKEECCTNKTLYSSEYLESESTDIIRHFDNLGRISIPPTILAEIGIKAGDDVEILKCGKGITLIPVSPKMRW